MSAYFLIHHQKFNPNYCILLIFYISPTYRINAQKKLLQKIPADKLQTFSVHHRYAPPLKDQARMQIHLHLRSNILNDEDKTE